MRVLLLTDSLSLPREYPGGRVAWGDIYVNLLRKAFPGIEFVHVGIGGATISELLRLQNYYALIEPDLVILQCGIVDCAPRALGELEQQIVKKLHLFRFIRPFTGFLRRHRGVTYTPPRCFEENLLALKGKFPGVPFLAIGILPGCSEYESIVPGVSANIVKYNAILRKHADFIDNTNFPREGITPDHHHMNEAGHRVVYEKLLEKIARHLQPSQPGHSADCSA